jgi:hypothetical protein
MCLRLNRRAHINNGHNSTLVVLTVTFLFAPVCFAQTGSSDPDLSGTWLDDSNSAIKIAFQEKGDNIKVHETDGDKVIADYTCTLNGTQCEVKEDGRPAKVMLYYNGSKLVEITERGSDVEKRRFSLSSDGSKMQMEVIPMSSSGKTITRSFQKQEPQVAKST